MDKKQLVSVRILLRNRMNKGVDIVRFMIRGYSVPQSADWRTEEANHCSVVGTAESPRIRGTRNQAEGLE